MSDGAAGGVGEFGDPGGSSAELLPMFPLGSVLFPSMLLPLRVFEPRYRAMVGHCLEHQVDFGVVLIERGSEVGGGDVCSDIGCRASIVHAEPRPDGEWYLVAIGTRRLRVHRWLDDDPYPRAEILHWPEEPAPDLTETDEDLLLDVARSELREVLELAAAVGAWRGPVDVGATPDPAVGSHQLASMTPLGAFDRQRLLAAPGTAARLTMLRGLLADQAALLRARLEGE